MKKYITNHFRLISSLIILFLSISLSFPSRAEFSLNHYEETDDGYWKVVRYGTSGAENEGRVRLHLLMDSEDINLKSINNYYHAYYYDADGNYQEAVYFYHPESLKKEDEINGKIIYTADIGYPIGDWYFTGTSFSYGSLPDIYTLDKSFSFPTQDDTNNYTPFSVTTDTTTNIYAIQGDEDFLSIYTDLFCLWAKERENGLIKEQNILTDNDVISVQEEELQNISIVEEEMTEAIKEDTKETAIPQTTSATEEYEEYDDATTIHLQAMHLYIGNFLLFFGLLGFLVYKAKKKY